MTRTTTKRKSESALPPAKHRKGEKSYSVTPSPERSSDGLFNETPVAAKHVKKRARRSEPAPKTRVDDEYDEDLGRTESQSFLALVEFESKKKRTANKENAAYMEKWEKRVQDKEDKFKRALDQAQKLSTKRDKQFLEGFKSAYGASRPQLGSPDGQTSSTPNFAGLYNKSKELTSTASVLIAKYEEVSRRIEDIDTSKILENEWGEQVKVMASLLQEGKEIGVEKYRHILNGSKKAKMSTSEEGIAGSEGLFFDGEKVKGAWGLVAKKQTKAIKKLVKIPQVAEKIA